MNTYQLLNKRTSWENWACMGGCKKIFKEIKLWDHTIAQQRTAINTVFKLQVYNGHLLIT
jgi:hypothetical protein